MAIPWVPIPEGSRVRIRQTQDFPQDPALLGKSGTVMATSEYSPENVGVTLDGSAEVRYFAPQELEVTAEDLLPPEREAAKQRRSLP